MSRSYKKPVLKLRNDKGYKKLFNRRIRRNSHLVGSGGEYKKHNDSYDICDFSTGLLDEEYVKSFYGDKSYKATMK